MIKEVQEKVSPSMDSEEIGELFKLACLLHDVGHAPFSHTGEEFYLGKDHNYTQLHNKLIETIGNDNFSKSIPEDSSSAAASHEIMSAIIGISEFEMFFSSAEQKEFFARCITGYKYSEGTIENNIKNCFIAMLNSKVIDVDKLDYLIRDAYITGFDTVNIDFERLLSSLTISATEGKYEIAYYKNAISVIENVVYAHDAERKWIQTHPVVLYEVYILQHIISYLSEKFDSEDKKLFSLESLSKKGQRFENGLSISLLCDDDIIYLMKNYFHNELCEEFFERRIRRHPVWKSETEYKAFVLDSASGGKWLEKFEKAMSLTAMYLLKSTDSWVIDKGLIAKLEKEKEILLNTEMNDIKTKNVQLEDKEMILRVIRSLKAYADEKEIDCNFVILKASQFSSGFGKSDFSAINIAFQTKEGEKVAAVGDIVSALKAKERDRDDFFYLFYKRKEGIDANKNDIDNQEICEKLFKDVVF